MGETSSSDMGVGLVIAMPSTVGEGHVTPAP
jgi:hypothetical protein